MVPFLGLVVPPYVSNKHSDTLVHYLRKQATMSPLKSPESTSMLFPSPRPSAAPIKSSKSTGNLYGMKKNVSFSTVNIREYERTLGNHPDVAGGPPITFDWDYQEAGSLPVEQYEDRKGNNAKRNENASRVERSFAARQRNFSIRTRMHTARYQAGPTSEESVGSFYQEQ